MTRMVFEYALLRAVPRLDRGECTNIGVLLYCQERDFLAAGVQVNARRLTALHASVDLDAVNEAADAVRRACSGDGPAGQTSLGQRFRWLTSPRSTIVRAGSVHSGLTADPAAELERLTDLLVR